MNLSVRRFLHGEEPLGEIPPGRELLLRALRIAWPSILESFLVALVGLIDTIMVSSLGSYAIAAVGLTTQPKFICLAVFISMNVAVSALVARRKGENDRNSANSVLLKSLLLGLAAVAVISTLAVTFAHPILRMAGTNADTHEAAVAYFRIIAGGLIFNAVSMIINAAQRGSGNTRIAMRTNLVSNLVNIAGNYLLIGGRFGFPRLGIQGAAIATVIGSMIACGMSICSLIRKDRFLSLHTFLHLQPDHRSMKALLRLCSNTLVEQLFMRIGFLLYSLVIANLGTNAFAAHQAAINILSISFSFGDGISVAAVSLVGQSLGQKRPDLGKIYGSLCQRIGVAFSVFLCIIYTVFGNQIFSLFTSDPEILGYGSVLLKLIAIIVFMQISQVVYFGCLRGGGDTRFTAFISLISIAIFRPLTGWLFCYPLGLGLTGAWLGLMTDQFIRLLMSCLRFKSGKWAKYKL